MIFSGCAYILMGTILSKYGWNRSLDNTIYEPLLDGMSALAAHVKTFLMKLF